MATKFASMQSIFTALVKAHGYADGQRIFAWFCAQTRKERESVALLGENETVADVIEGIAFWKKASRHPDLKPTELEAIPLFEEEDDDDMPMFASDAEIRAELLSGYGEADAKAIFDWFKSLSLTEQAELSNMEDATITEVVDGIVYDYLGESVPEERRKRIEDATYGEPEITINTNTNPQKPNTMERKEIAKRLATAKAQVTRYTHKLEEFDTAQAVRKEQRAKARKEHAKQLTDADKQPLQFGDYSTKCLIVFGGTKSRLDKFTELKNKGLCSYNSALRYDSKGEHSESENPKGGWLFYKSKTADVKALKALFN